MNFSFQLLILTKFHQVNQSPPSLHVDWQDRESNACMQQCHTNVILIVLQDSLAHGIEYITFTSSLQHRDFRPAPSRLSTEGSSCQVREMEESQVYQSANTTRVERHRHCMGLERRSVHLAHPNSVSRR